MPTCYATREAFSTWELRTVPQLLSLTAMRLDSSDLHRLKAAVGWLELGNAAEALKELDDMSFASQEHSDVLEARWLALARLLRWEAAAKVGRKLIAAAPERSVG